MAHKKAPKVSGYTRTRGGKTEHYAIWRLPLASPGEKKYQPIWLPLELGPDASPLDVENEVAKIQALLNQGIDPRAGTIDLDAWLGKYFDWLKARRSERSRDIAARALGPWREWLRTHHPALMCPRDLTYHDHIEAFETWRLAQPRLVPAKNARNVKGATGTHIPDPTGKTVAARSVNIEMQQIRNICKWSLEADEKGNTRGYLVTDPTAPRKKLKEPDADTHALELSTAQAIEAVIGNGPRDSSIVHARVHRIMIETGRRTHELFECKRTDLQAESARLRYRDRKTGKAKHCDLSPRAVAWLKEWAERPGEDKALVPVSRRAFVERLRRACKKLGIKRYGPHTLRHTHGTWLLDNGASLREVQVSLDHARIETTTRYTHVSRGKLKQVVGTIWKSSVDEVLDTGKPKAAKPRQKRAR